MAERLGTLGVDVTKVNFNAGDAWFFRDARARVFDAPFDDWPAWFEALLREKRIDAVLLFGQWRPLHRVARTLAAAHGLPVYVFEEGYVRPWWITMEAGGVNEASALHHVDPSRLPDIPEPPPPVRHRFAFFRMAMYSTWYGVVAWLGQRRFPHYRHHRPLHVVEAGRWLRCGIRKWAHRLTERRVVAALLDPAGRDYFLVPLQLDADSQIRHSSPWGSNARFIEAVLTSFAAHAEPAYEVVFRHHPLERGHADYRRLIDARAAGLGLSGRVRYIHDGALPRLLKRARGVVLVNSTTGVQALYHGVPVCATGRPFYARGEWAGTTSMDAFWCDPLKPDRERFAAFYRYMLATTQINASFYACGDLFPAWERPWVRLVRRAACSCAAVVVLGSGAQAPAGEGTWRPDEASRGDAARQRLAVAR
nr:capsular biosynthesis protein [Robbsia betulipollinis]